MDLNKLKFDERASYPPSLWDAESKKCSPWPI